MYWPREAPQSFRPDPKYCFDDYKTIIRDRDRALEGLKVAIAGTAELIANDLDEHNPLIYIYSPASIWASGGMPLNVGIGGRSFTLTFPGCQLVRLPPGHYTLTGSTTPNLIGLKKSASPLALDVETGKTYYIREKSAAMGYGFKVVPEQEGAAAIKKFKTNY